MNVVAFVRYLFAGVLLTNSVPHFVIGLTGRRNLTPFGRDSSPQVNVLWAIMNFLGGAWLVRATDRQREAHADDTAWLVPYEIGCAGMALFGVYYSSKTAITSTGKQDKA